MSTTTITKVVTGYQPSGIQLTALQRMDTGGAVSGVTLPASLTNTSGTWSITFTDPSPGLSYFYTLTVTWPNGNVIELAPAIEGPYNPFQSGYTLVTHNTGGTDNLRVELGGVGLGDVIVQAFLQSDYNAAAYTVRGYTLTGDDGRWLNPMFLTAGLAYVFVAQRPGVTVATVSSPVTI